MPTYLITGVAGFIGSHLAEALLAQGHGAGGRPNDGVTTLAPTHQVDYFRNRVAVETEWNNKDPFFDRDLTTFRLLFELNVLSVGVIITRASELQTVFDELGRGASYGQSTTHMGKLLPKLENRSSGGCPVLAFGIKRAAYDVNT